MSKSLTGINIAGIAVRITRRKSPCVYQLVSLRLSNPSKRPFRKVTHDH
jgi:hypothetical protein